MPTPLRFPRSSPDTSADRKMTLPPRKRATGGPPDRIGMNPKLLGLVVCAGLVTPTIFQQLNILFIRSREGFIHRAAKHRCTLTVFGE